MSNYKDMTNEEIWEMLKPKMEKNGLKSTTSTVRLPAQWCYGDSVDIVKSYEENMVHNAIALAYKAGYLRAIKGRPFKIGEKKKGGHWEPVDPKNLPKEGTKVRYNRKCKDYTDDIIMIGDTGIVAFEGIFNPMWFGMKLDKTRKEFFEWVDFSADGNATCLDMWVEDDE